MDISVIICSHRPRADFLDETLRGLMAQTLDRAEWELLCIDNANPEPLAGKVDLRWHPRGRLLVEPRLGLTRARLLGIREAQGDLLVFVDDDNVLAPNYLTCATEISREWTKLGAWGGQCLPRYEAEPDPVLRKYLPMLGIRELKRDVWSNLPIWQTAPIGAGMCVRREVARSYAGRVAQDENRARLGRIGGQLFSGEDYDLVYSAHELGLGSGVFTRLRLTHLIAAHRVTPEYLARLCEGTFYSNALVNHFCGLPPERTGWTRRLIAFGKALGLSRVERRIFRAGERGTRAAMETLREMASPAHSR